MPEVTSLQDMLASLGLDKYTAIFLDEGFDTWQTICEVTEADLDYMDVKLGHRRKLQRAIADSLASPSHSSNNSSTLRLSKSNETDPQSDGKDTSAFMSESTSYEAREGSVRTKRKYRRHPKPDVNAPIRPQSAYVLFANDVRDHLKDKDECLDFSSIAKTVGARWQNLAIEEREKFESIAIASKEKYNADMNEYRKTGDHEQYQKYLQDFKRRHEGRDNKARRSNYALGSHEKRPDDESAPNHNLGTSSGDVGSSAQVSPQYQIAAVNSPSNGLRNASSFSQSSYETASSTWSPQTDRPQVWGTRYAVPIPARPQQQPRITYDKSGPTSPRSRQNPAVNGLSSHLITSGDAPQFNGALPSSMMHGSLPQAQQSYSTSSYSPMEDYQRPAAGKSSYLPSLLNPMSNSPFNSRATNERSAGEGESHNTYQAKLERRAQWRDDTLPDLYRVSGSTQMRQGSEKETTRPSPTKSPFTGRMMDGMMTPPPRPANAATSPRMRQFPMEKSIPLSTAGWDQGSQHTNADALLDGELGSYRTGPKESAMRSRRSSQAPSH